MPNTEDVFTLAIFSLLFIIGVLFGVTLQADKLKVGCLIETLPEHNTVVELSEDTMIIEVQGTFQCLVLD